MNLIELSQDNRPHNGRNKLFINPEEVCSVHRNYDTLGNDTVVVLKNGDRFQVEGWPEDVAKKLFP